MADFAKNAGRSADGLCVAPFPKVSPEIAGVPGKDARPGNAIVAMAGHCAVCADRDGVGMAVRANRARRLALCLAEARTAGSLRCQAPAIWAGCAAHRGLHS